MKLLLVEDDQRITKTLAEAMTSKNYAVEIATDGETGLDLAQTFTYNLIVLDVMLPKLDGITLCQRLRQTGNKTLILMLTAKDTSLDKVIGLDAGADDYLIKPFDVPELLARIRALLRRGNPSLSPILEWEHLYLDPSQCEVRYKQQKLHLTPKEYSLLELFLHNGERVLSRDAILQQIWSFESMPEEQTVKVHLQTLRKKLKEKGAPHNLIENVYGLGYRLNPNL
ncbi:response regulator transcription factor [Mastigocoleus testarum]|uniref:Two-component system response regulator n=1 Tax=Mastigocoleus testarum BC008 TaxID=371196 RepID=A0A0V7ZUL8_9CYAN|nr:response regulator transcription factor [Mastigocoleus testarum]KST68233.1 two-component system response regulator [Mastigocoleus testarum BC008]